MKNLKKMNFTKLNPSEMKQVNGGGVVDGVKETLKSIGPILGTLLTGLFGSTLPKK